MADQSPVNEPGYGRNSSGMIVHRIRKDGNTYCPDGYAAAITDRVSALDAIRNHGARLCNMCTHLMSAERST